MPPARDLLTGSLLWLAVAAHAESPDPIPWRDAALPAAALAVPADGAAHDGAATNGADDAGTVDAAAATGGVPALREFARGIASWYGARFHGRKTASGEPFDMHALTAAHPTLPFGTRVRVRSLVNGREVTVRINDRGPHVGRRLIDLSRAAAQALGLIESGAGTKPVVISVEESPSAADEAVEKRPRR